MQTAIFNCTIGFILLFLYVFINLVIKNLNYEVLKFIYTMKFINNYVNIYQNYHNSDNI